MSQFIRITPQVCVESLGKVTFDFASKSMHIETINLRNHNDAPQPTAYQTVEAIQSYIYDWFETELNRIALEDRPLPDGNNYVI